MKQLDAALGGNISALDALKSMKSTHDQLPGEPARARSTTSERRPASLPVAAARPDISHDDSERTDHRAASPAAPRAAQPARRPAAPRGDPLHAAGRRDRLDAAALSRSARPSTTASRNWDGFTSQWIGLAAYRRLFAQPRVRDRCSRTTAILVLAIPIAIMLPLAVAFLINSHVRGWRFFRSVFFLPTAVSWVVIALRRAAVLRSRQAGDPAEPAEPHRARLPAPRPALARALGADRGGDHLHLVGVRDEHDHLPRRHGDDRPGDLRRRHGRRRGPVEGAVPDHVPAAEAVRPVRVHHQPDHRVQRAVQPDHRDDERRARATARRRSSSSSTSRRSPRTTSASGRRRASCCSSSSSPSA